MAEIPKPVGYWCDHEDEPPGERTHEGWEWSDEDGRVWARQPDTIGSHAGLHDWDPQHRRCPRAVPVYAVDAPAMANEIEQLRAAAAMWRSSYDWLSAKALRFRWAWQSAQRGRRKARAELALAMGPTMYLQVQKVLDGALGGRREDGAGAGLVAEIRLLAERMTAAEGERDESAKQVTCLTEVMAGTVLLGADDAVGMLRALTESLVEDGTLTADQAAQVYAGLDKQQDERDRLRAELTAALGKKPLGRAYIELRGFAQRETARADSAEAERDDARRELQTAQGEIEHHIALNVDLHAALDQARAVPAGQDGTP